MTVSSHSIADAAHALVKESTSLEAAAVGYVHHDVTLEATRVLIARHYASAALSHITRSINPRYPDERTLSAADASSILPIVANGIYVIAQFPIRDSVDVQQIVKKWRQRSDSNLSLSSAAMMPFLEKFLGWTEEPASYYLMSIAKLKIAVGRGYVDGVSTTCCPSGTVSDMANFIRAVGAALPASGPAAMAPNVVGAILTAAREVIIRMCDGTSVSLHS